MLLLVVLLLFFWIFWSLHDLFWILLSPHPKQAKEESEKGARAGWMRGVLAGFIHMTIVASRTGSSILFGSRGIATLLVSASLSLGQGFSSMSSFKPKDVDAIVLSRWQNEGVGARVRRSIGGSQLRNFDPFLMLDEFLVGKPAGFADHPHRGFETVTYMLEGTFEHQDFAGHRGKIGPGDLQWMTAGRGIVHAEMPCGDDKALGLQLWVNLAREHKMVEPQYQELKAEDIPQITKDGVSAIVIAGTALGTTSPVYTRTPTHYIHYKMEPNRTLEHAVPTGWNTFIYILNGKVKVGGSWVDAHNTVTFKLEGDGVSLSTGEEAADFVLLCGKPHNEPIVQHGPFVLNTNAEIMQAMQDYQSNSNGFERARKWRSEIAKPLMGGEL